MKVYILLLLSLLSASTSYAIKPKTAQELAPSGMDLLPREIKVLILEQLIDKKSLDNSIKNIKNMAMVNKEFNEIINHPQNFKWLIHEIILLHGRNEYIYRDLIYRFLADMPAMKDKEIKEWISNQQKLWTNIKGANLAEVKKYLQRGANVNYKGGNEDKTALHMAITSGLMTSIKLEVVAELLKSQANINAQDIHGDTPLMYALEGSYAAEEKVQETQLELVKLLLQHNPDLSLRNAQGKTVLDIAIEDGNKEIIELLKKYKK